MFTQFLSSMPTMSSFKMPYWARLTVGFVVFISGGMYMRYLSEAGRMAPAPIVGLVDDLTPAEAKPSPSATPVAASLPSFIAALMAECTVKGREHSPAKLALLSKQIERAASAHLTGNDRHAFAALLCLETRMGTSASQTSHAGARGIAQLMLATARPEAVRCGLGAIKDDDLYDNEVNLNLAACHYAELVRTLGSAIAPIAYNGGASSSSVKALQHLSPPTNLESASYAATVAVIMARFLYEENKK